MKIQELIDETNKIIKRDDFDQIKKLYSNNIEDWEKYIIKKNNYTRSLVFKNDKFQLIIMTWPGNFESFIHDHNKNECIFKVLKGGFIEKIYYKNEDKLELKELNKLLENEIGNINDNSGYHSVKNSSSDFAVSIHLYIKTDQTKDVDQVNIFILDDEMKFNKKTIFLKYDN
jgi:predicted metal-dependent enzyme (double-stranded beta helix superfamily)